jgi:hypothetical protein
MSSTVEEPPRISVLVGLGLNVVVVTSDEASRIIMKQPKITVAARICV